MEANKNAASRHVAVLAFPFGTHAAPLLTLVRQLSEACPATVFSFLSTRQSNAATFKDEVENVKPFHVWDGLPEGYRFKGNPHEPVEHFVKAIPENYTKVIEEAVDEIGRPIDCLITDAFYAFGADIADEMNVPWVALWTAGPRALLVHVETDVIREHAGINGPKDRSLDFLPEFSTIRVADLPEGIVFSNLDAPIPSLLHKMGHTLSRATAIAANSYEDLDNKIVDVLKSRYNNKFLNVGPFNLISSTSNPVDDSHGCLNWLSMHEPASVVYISFGSVITPPPHELEALSEALEETELPFLWSFRGNPEKELPLGFLERTSSRGKIVPWAPQKKILEHASVGVFVSHGGWNSVLESIVGGVPMILRPFFGDQRLNTRTVEAVWEFGLGLKGGIITKQGAMKALSLTLCGGEGKMMREKIGVHKELAYMAVKPDGGSVQNLEELVKIVGGA